MCAVLGSVATCFSPAPYARCILPDQLREVAGGLAEPGRAVEIVLAPLVAPGFDGGRGVGIAFG